MLINHLNGLSLSKSLLDKLKRSTWDPLLIEQERKKKEHADLSFAKWQLDNNDDRCFITLMNYAQREARKRYQIGSFSDGKIYFLDLIKLEINRIERIYKKEIYIKNNDASREFETLKNSLIFYLLCLLLEKELYVETVKLKEIVPKNEIRTILKALSHLKEFKEADVLFILKIMLNLKQNNFKKELFLHNEKMKLFLKDYDLRRFLKFNLISIKQNLRRNAFKEQFESFNKEKKVSYRKIIAINHLLSEILTEDIKEELDVSIRERLKKDNALNSVENLRLSAFLSDDSTEVKKYFIQALSIIRRSKLGVKEFFITCGRQDEYLAFLEKNEFERINYFYAAEHAYSKAKIGRSYLMTAIRTVLNIKLLSRTNLQEAIDVAKRYQNKNKTELSKILPELEETIYLVSLLNKELSSPEIDFLLKRGNELSSMILSSYFAKKAVTFEDNKAKVKYQSFFDLAIKSILNKESIDKYLFGVEESLQTLILEGESDRLEFKSSLRWDIVNDKLERRLEKEIIKAIAGFSNGQGGSLLIGVRDDGEILGLEKDYSTLRGTKDNFELFLRELIEKNIGGEFNARIKISFLKHNQLEICQVLIDKGANPIYIVEKNKNGNKMTKFYVRLGNRTPALTVKEAISYCKERFY